MQHRPTVPLEFRPFSRADYRAYQGWFINKDIDTALGPIDEEWLEYILRPHEGPEYAVYRADLLVAVVGLFLSDRDPAYSVITDLAVNPNLFGQGIGSAVLLRLYELHPLAPGNRWVAYVAARNNGAQRFFLRNGYGQEASDDAQLLAFSKSVAA